jgi:hypothetical protein
MRKMILVPEVMLDTLARRDQQQSTAELDQVVRLDREIEQLLNRKDLSLQQKASMYNDIVQQYLHYRKEAREAGAADVRGAAASAAPALSANITAEERRSDHDELAALTQASLPKSYHSKGQRLLAQMRNSGFGNWSPTTHEFIYNGQPIKGTNISDLLYYAAVPSKRAAPPGATEFIAALRAANVPRILQRTDLKSVQVTPQQQPLSGPKRRPPKKTADDFGDPLTDFEDAPSTWIT